MTWIRTAQTPVSVVAYEIGYVNDGDKIRLGVGTQFVDLSAEDAASLGGYLLSHAQKDDGE